MYRVQRMEKGVSMCTKRLLSILLPFQHATRLPRNYKEREKCDSSSFILNSPFGTFYLHKIDVSRYHWIYHPHARCFFRLVKLPTRYNLQSNRNMIQPHGFAFGIDTWMLHSPPITGLISQASANFHSLSSLHSHHATTEMRIHSHDPVQD